jgi:hypothetical protein
MDVFATMVVVVGIGITPQLLLAVGPVMVEAEEEEDDDDDTMADAGSKMNSFVALYVAPVSIKTVIFGSMLLLLMLPLSSSLPSL